jgi:amidase
LKGARLGVVRVELAEQSDLVTANFERALEALKAQGAVLVDVTGLPTDAKLGSDELGRDAHGAEGRHPAYLAEYAPDAPVKTLADVIAFNEKHRAQVMPVVRAGAFRRRGEKGGLDSPEYLAARTANLSSPAGKASTRRWASATWTRSSPPPRGCRGSPTS